MSKYIIMVIFIFWKFSINLSSKKSRQAESWQSSLGYSSLSKLTHRVEGEQSYAGVKWCACALTGKRHLACLVSCQTLSFESVAKTPSCLYVNKISGWIRICPTERLTRNDLAWSHVFKLKCSLLQPPKDTWDQGSTTENSIEREVDFPVILNQIYAYSIIKFSTKQEWWGTTASVFFFHPS